MMKAIERIKNRRQLEKIVENSESAFARGAASIMLSVNYLSVDDRPVSPAEVADAVGHAKRGMRLMADALGIDAVIK